MTCWQNSNASVKEIGTIKKLISQKECVYLSVTHRFEQKKQDGLEVFIPHLQGVFTNQLEQLTQGRLPLLNAFVVIGQLFEQLGHQLRLVQTAVCGNRNKTSITTLPLLSNRSLCLGPSISVPSVKCSESSMLVSLRLCLKGESKKCSRVPRGLEESRGVLRRDVLLSRAMRPPSITSDPLPSVPLSPCTDAISLYLIIPQQCQHIMLYIQSGWSVITNVIKSNSSQDF